MKFPMNRVKDESLENLFQCLDYVHSSNNLMILDKSLSGIINDLTPFSKLKNAAKIEKIVWINDYNEISKSHYKNIIQDFNGVVIIIKETLENFTKLKDLIEMNGNKPSYVIVENLSKSFIYKFNQLKLNHDSALSLETITNYNNSIKFVEFSSLISVLNWNLLPVLIDDSMLSIEMNDGIKSYFKNPIKVTTKLSEAVIKLLKISPVKINNVYGLGDHSALLINMIQDKKAEFENSLGNFERLEIDKIGTNCDLVVLERNLDYLSPLFNQLNYSGLLNDCFGINFNQVEIPKGFDGQEERRDSASSLKSDAEKFKLEDELYKDLKNLNFASIGLTLNKSAKYLQQEFETRHAAQSINEIKNFVDKLGDLTSKQDLIKKHTMLSESILNFINNNENDESTFVKKFLELQNDLLELDYKKAFDEVSSFINQEAPLEIVLRFICLVSLIYNGLKLKDFNLLKTEITQTYGIKNLTLINNLLKYGIIHIKQQTSQFPFTSQPQPTPAEIENEKLGVSASASCVKDYLQAMRFLNLQPIEEDDGTTNVVETNDLEGYSDQSFSLPGGLVPILTRLVESLYLREFLVKPINNLSKRPNWKGLNLDNYFHGKQVYLNLSATKEGLSRNPKSVFQDLTEEIILVSVIGGITYGEISSFKYLEYKLNLKYNPSGINKRIILLSDGIVKSNDLIDICKETI